MNDWIDEDEVLELVDEYTLYCHYLEFEPELRWNYSSPLRSDDQSPSFAVFPSVKADREYFWKDSGAKGDSGDIFKLVQLLYGFSSRWEALVRVKSDFKLGEILPDTPKIVRNTVIIKDPADIRIKSRTIYPDEYAWWNCFNISPEILTQYRVSGLYWFKLKPSQYTPVFPPKFSFVYRVYDRYQLYFPFQQKGAKFRSDLLESYVMGLEQLTFTSDTLIITKSYKDVMCLRSFGYEAVSPRSENVPMPQGFFDWVNARYTKKLVLFDNDMKHRGEWYPYKKIYVPEQSGSKDPTDFVRDHGVQEGAEMLRSIILYE